MNLRDQCIRRPVLALAINLVLLLGGLYALAKLPVRFLPRFDVPVVTITTVLPGGSPDMMERTVTVPLERAVLQVDGIDIMTSASISGTSTITVMFRSDVNAADAAQSVRAQVNQAQVLLPAGTLAPVVQQISIDSQASLHIAVRDPSRSALELTDIVEQRLRPMISLLPGVAGLQVLGSRDYAVRVTIDRFELAGYGLTVDDVVAALAGQNVELPGGEVSVEGRRITVLAQTSLAHPREFGDILVREGVTPLRLQDVAQVEVGARNTDTAVRVNGQSALAVGLLRQSSANPVDISRAVHALLPELRAAAPPGIELDVVYDDAIFIQASVDEVTETVGITIGLVVLVVLLFLGSLRSSLIALIAVPLSLGGGLAFLLLMGYSLNTFTLLAFVLVIGLVVDDAIVEVENAQRHIDAGMAPMPAAFRSSRELAFPVLAMTVTLAAVFAPIGLLPGMTGALFREFGLTLAMTVLFSGFVAMTLSPMMCARMLRPQRGVALLLERAFHAIGAFYRRVLAVVLRFRWLMLLAAVALGAGGCFMMTRLDGTLAPTEDQGYALVLFAGPQDASMEYMQARAAELEKVIEEGVPERAAIMTLLGVPVREQGVVFVLMKPWEQRQRSVVEIQQAVEARLAGIPGLRVSMIDPNPLGGGGQYPIQFILKATLEHRELLEAAQPLIEAMQRHPGLRAVSPDVTLDSPSFMLEVDRDRAADLGIPLRTLADILGKLFGDQEVSRFSWQGDLHPVMLGIGGRIDPALLSQIHIRGIERDMVPIAAVAAAHQVVAPASLPRTDNLRSVTISADIVHGHSIGAVAADVQAMAQRLLPGNIRTDWGGMVRQMRSADASMLLVFLLSIAFIFLVLAAQFESFRDPFIVLSVAPLSIAGAGAALVLNGGSLNLYSGIGFVTLIGLVAKHGILITEFANQLRDEDPTRPKMEAVLDAAVIRLRPILMTTAAMVLGALPLMLATGPGSASRRDIGTVIVGGLVFGTLLSLFVVPAVYLILSRRDRKPMPAVPSDAELGMEALPVREPVVPSPSRPTRIAATAAPPFVSGGA
jgi:multidrug efflux pump